MESVIRSKVKVAVKQIEPSAEIILFGSRARESYHSGSDWDFLILVDGEVDSARVDRIRHQIFEIELETGELLSSIVKNRNDWNSPRLRMIPLHDSIEQDGIIL